jgi:NAD(P)-dependent dehydrogenase (short-subunit alcohol dehydrogenase family)
MSVAVVTGGGRGIGAAAAVALAGAGWDVCVGYRDDESAASKVVARCEALDRRAIAVRGDVASEADVLALFAAADALGPVSVLVNNAGIAAPKARVDEVSVERVERLVAVNAVGAFMSAREAVRRMSTAHGGRGGAIVNVSSAAARLGSPGEYVDYAATKGFVDTLTIGLAREVGAEGVRVNAVRPGLIETDIHAAGGRPDRVEQLAHTVPMGRGGSAEEVAAVILWLCSDAASYVTGSIVDVSGGR